MTQEYHQPVLDPIENSIATTSDHRRISINDDDDDDSAAPVLPLSCPYSRPFLFLDMIWNLAFVMVSIIVLLITIRENPSTPLRLWIGGYALQSLLHVAFVWDEYRKTRLEDGAEGFQFHGVFSVSSLCHNSIIRRLEPINTVISSIWWVFGFYWIVLGGQMLLLDSPRLYWLSVFFLAIDVLFVIFCIAMACIVCFALFCCFPILGSVAYAMSIGNGASENEIKSLPKYLYRKQIIGGTDENDQNKELEDPECCICLYKYVDGSELCPLPCRHHFHHKCITKWLRINATCPLCKFNILRGDTLV